MPDESKKRINGTKRPLWVRLLRCSLFFVLGLIILLALIWAGLQTPWAKNRLAGLIESATESTGEFRVTLEGLDGLIPFSMVVDRVALSDADGAWLEADKVNISLRVEALLTGVVDVKWFRIKHLSVSRLPQSTQGASNKGKGRVKGSETALLPNVMVREIRIKRIDLGEQVVGKPMAFRLNSLVETTGGSILAEATLQDMDSKDNAFKLTLGYDLNSEEVSSNVTYHESPGGLFAGLIGLEEADGIRLALEAYGPLSDVKGRLNLNVGGYGGADINYRVGLNQGVTVAVDGEVRAENRIVPKDVAALLGTPTLGITCQALLLPGKLLQIESFTAKSCSAEVSLRGVADLDKEEMDLRALVSGVDLSYFLKETGMALQDLGKVHLTAKGPFIQPDVTVKTTVGLVRAHGLALGKAALAVEGKFKEGFTGLESAAAGLTARVMQTSQAPGLKGPLRLEVLVKSPDYRAWDVETIHLTAPDIDVRVDKAVIDTVKGSFSAELRAEVDRLTALLPPLEPAVNGRMVMSALVDGDYMTHRFRADLNASFTRISGLPPEAAAAIGTELTLISRATIKEDILNLEQAHLKGVDADVKADGRLDIGKGTFDGEYSLNLMRISSLGDSVGTSMTGSVTGRGRISGSLRDFGADIDLSSRQIRVKDLQVERMQTNLEVKGLPHTPTGSVRMEGRAMDKPLGIDAEFAWSGETLLLSRVRANLPGIDLNADFSMTPSKERLSGTARGKVKSLEFLRALAGVDAEGSGAFLLKAECPGRDIGLTLDASLRDLRYRDYGASTVDLKAQVDDLKTLRGEVSAKATDVVLQKTQLKRLNLGAKGSIEGAAVTLEAKGTTGVSDLPISLTSKLSVKRTEKWRFRLETMKATYKGLDLTLKHPATVAMDDQGVILDNLQLQTKKARLQMTAKLDQRGVEATARVDDLPLALLEPFVGQDLSGVAAIDIDLSGPLADPAVSVGVDIREFEILGQDSARPLMVDMKLNSRRDGDRFVADLELSGLGKTPFSANLSVPAHFSLSPFAIHLDGEGALVGKLQGRLNLAVLQKLPAMRDQILRGKVDMKIGVGGSLKKWDLDGWATISKGRYENVKLGVLLADINGRLDPRGRTLQLTGLTATDGNSGKVTLEGGMATETPFPMNANLTFKRATLLRKDALTSMASGTITIKGDMNRLDMKGKILLDRTEVAIPNRFPPDVTVIPVKEINLPAGIAAQEPKMGEGADFLYLDLDVDIPDKFFVRGRGLDSEFKGKLKALGPADDPVIRGTLNVVRGTFKFLSRTFDITSGQIAFDGATPPVPFLNITTEVNSGEIDARVRITGPADAFRLSLTSQPPLPQDEIMAQILFGQSVAKLNTFQALQLASSVNQLAGGYWPDIVGETRDFLGLDRLGFSGGVGDDDDDGPSVSLGKYVSERVYVGVEQNITDSKQDVIVEINITPDITVESKAGSKSGAGIGINWNYDY